MLQQFNGDEKLLNDWQKEVQCFGEIFHADHDSWFIQNLELLFQSDDESEKSIVDKVIGNNQSVVSTIDEKHRQKLKAMYLRHLVRMTGFEFVPMKKTIEIGAHAKLLNRRDRKWMKKHWNNIQHTFECAIRSRLPKNSNSRTEYTYDAILSWLKGQLKKFAGIDFKASKKNKQQKKLVFELTRWIYRMYANI